MYKILNKLFGWDYIAWKNSADNGIAKINKSPDGRVYYWRYRGIRVFDIVHESNQVLWLTCKPDKYFNKE